MSDFNANTLPDESTELGGRGSGRWEQSDVLNYVSQFNQAVLLGGTTPPTQPGVVSRNRNVFFGGNETIELSDAQINIARGFFADEVARGQNLRNFVAQVRRLNDRNQNLVSDQQRDEINIFLEILEAARVQGGDPLPFNEPRAQPGRNPLGGSRLANEEQIRAALSRWFESTPDIAENRQLSNEEAFNSIVQRQQGILSILTPSILQSGLVNLYYKNIYQIEALDSANFVSLFIKEANPQQWFQASTALLSCITPKIKIYKQYNNLENSEKINVVFKFPTKTTETDIEALVSGNRRGSGYGIKSFSWDFEGQNPYEISRNIKANLELFIQDLDSLFPPEAEISNEFVRFERSTDSISEGYLFELFRNIRLTSDTGGNNTESDSATSVAGSFIDPYDYRLKIEIGWEFDRSTLRNLGLGEYIDLLEKTRNTLDLGLESHNLNFNQDGTINISLTYRSYFDSLLQNADFFNVLSIGTDATDRLLSWLERTRNTTSEEDEEGEGSVPCQTPESTFEGNDSRTSLNKNSKIFKNLLEVDFNNPNNIINNYSAIFNKLIEESRIYVLGFDYGLIADEVTYERVDSILENSIEENETNSDREAYLRIITNELNLEAIKNADFNIARLTPDGVAALSGTLNSQAELLSEAADSQLAGDDAEIQQLTFNITAQSPLSVLNSGNVSANPYSLEPERTGRFVRTYFTTLGDILDVVLNDIIITNENQERIQKSDIPTFISGPYTFKDVDNREIIINLSNILIDIDAFRKFFAEKVISSLKTKYPLENFIKDLYSNFCYETSSRAVIQGNTTISTRSRLFYNKFSKTSNYSENELLTRLLNFFYSEESVRESNGSAISRFLGLAGTGDYFITDPTNTISIPRSSELLNRSFSEIVELLKPKIINVENFFKETNETLTSEGNDSSLFTNTPVSYGYIYISASPAEIRIPIEEDGYNYSDHRDADAERGIYHITYGAKDSIIKKLTFEKYDDPSLRAARVMGEGADSLNYLRELYNVNLELFGTPFLIPGQKIYLNPVFVGTGRDTQRSRNIGEFLGIGGYYNIINVSNKIDSNHNYTTNCRLLWETSGRNRDSNNCFLQNPLSLFTEEGIQTANVALREVNAEQRLEIARNNLSGAISQSGGTEGGADEYIFENYLIGASITRTPLNIAILITGDLIVEQGTSLLTALAFDAVRRGERDGVRLRDVNFKINIDPQDVNNSKINIYSASISTPPNDLGVTNFSPRDVNYITSIGTFIALNRNSRNSNIQQLIRELQTIFDANLELQSALNQQEAQSDQ